MALHDNKRGKDYAWPGPVGWWTIPLVWLLVLMVAMIAWSYH
jgi:hypothetical protein